MSKTTETEAVKETITDGLINSLRLLEQDQQPTNHDNDDADFGRFLDMYSCGEVKTHGKMLRYSDGSAKEFKFD